MKLTQVKNHFRQNDPLIFQVLVKMKFQLLTSLEADRGIYFRKLCGEIISQQLAGKAAEAIFNRFVKLMPSVSFTPKEVLSVADQALRNVGLSWAKVKYIKDLADKVTRRLVKLDHLQTLADEAVVAELVKVKGIGPWTAEMFLIFTLGRENIFSHGDLGLRNALIKLYRLRRQPTVARVNKIVNRWHPYKSYGSLALWHSLDNR